MGLRMNLLKAPLVRSWRQITVGRQGTYPVAHQGIQRSGTNFLCTLLDAADYRVLNRVDPPRNQPRHKHFRWQPDKSTIAMDSRYANRVTASTVAEVNAASRFPQDTKHVVIFRKPREWLDSIYRWGLKNRWFADEAEFFDRNLPDAYFREWDAYYAFWQEREADEPSAVMLFCHDDLKASAADVVAKVDGLCGIRRSAPLVLPGQEATVRHSRPISEKREALISPELDRFGDMEAAFMWKARVVAGGALPQESGA